MVDITPDTCDPCDCHPEQLALHKESRDQSILIIMCSILTALTGGGGGDLVAVTSVIPGTNSNQLGKAEDQASVSGDVGVMALFKRTDTAVVQTSANGDYTTPAANSFGVTLNDINQSFQSSAALGLLKLEDDPSASGDAGVAALYQRSDTATAQTSADGDYSVPTVNSFGATRVSINRTFQTTDANDLLKAEDSAGADGDAGVVTLLRRIDTPIVLTTTNGDYTVAAANSFGAAQINIDYTFQASVGSGLLKQAGVAQAAGDAGVKDLFYREIAPTSTTGVSTTNGQYSGAKVDDHGRLWVNISENALAAGSAIIGKVGIDQTTPGTTNAVSLSASSVIIGNVRIDQTTPGTTNGVQVNAALPAGSAIIGKFGIDQTTPGTTNAVALTAGTALVGKVGIDQTTPGTTNGVQVNAALPAGTNLIGKFGIDQTTPGTTNAVVATGNVASGATDSGNPVKIGFVGRTTNPTAVTDGQRVDALADKIGRKVVILNQVRDLVSDQSTTITSSTSATTVVTADASNKLDLVSLTFANSSATGTVVQLLNDDGTTVRWTGYVPATDMRGIVFSVPFTQTAVNKAWKVITVTSVASVVVTAQFVKNI